MKFLTFFNVRGGVGKTMLLHNVAHMLAQTGDSVLVADLDPQANATAMFLRQSQLEKLWDGEEHPLTVSGALTTFMGGGEGVGPVHVEEVAENLGFIAGDLALAAFEDPLSRAWGELGRGNTEALVVVTALYRLLYAAADARKADWVLIDTGPNLGSLNRAILSMRTNLVVPIGTELYSLQELRMLAPIFALWSQEWAKYRGLDLSLPSRGMTATGYVVMDNYSLAAGRRWGSEIPLAFREAMQLSDVATGSSPSDDSYCLATIRNYRSLMPMALAAHKPLYDLKAADGAIGASGEAVRQFREHIEVLTSRIRSRAL